MVIHSLDLGMIARKLTKVRSGRKRHGKSEKKSREDEPGKHLQSCKELDPGAAVPVCRDRPE